MVPSDSEQKAYYDLRWTEQTYIAGYSLQRLIAILEALFVTQINNPKILDLGAGTGWLTSILNEIGPTEGIELSQKAVERARVKYPSIKLTAGNILDTKFKKGWYDIVVSQEVIEHVEDQESYISIAANCLRKEGYLILTTPNKRNIKYRTKMEIGETQPIENWLNISDLKKLLSKKFQVIYFKTIIPDFGNRQIFRLINSAKVNHILSVFKLGHFKNILLLKFDLGLHIVLLARRL